MPLLSIVFGLLLVLLGAAGYFLGFVVGNGHASWTAWFPAFAGLPILLCGVGSALAPSLNKIFMHVAVTVGLLGALAPLGRIPKALSAATPNPLTLTSLFGMLALCAAFVALGVNSFVAARRSRKAEVDTD